MYENRVCERQYDGAGILYGLCATIGAAAGTAAFLLGKLILAGLLLMGLVGCKGGGTPTTPPPPPNPNDYEPLGTVHRLKYADGTDSNMWIKLLAINPPRGSRVEAKQQILFTVQVGVSGKDSAARIDLSWSADGTIGNEPSKSVGAPMDGQNPATFSDIQHWVTSATTLRYLIAQGNSQPSNKPPKWATTNFFVDYR